MRYWKLAVMSAAVAAASFGCAQKPSAPIAVIEDKVYTVTPDQIKVQAGIVSGEVTEMKVTERVEQGSGRVDTPAKLTGTLKLTNSSMDQTVRLVGGKLVYIDAQGQQIKVGEERTEPVIKFAVSYNSSDQLAPGQNATQTVEVDFPAEALKAGKLGEIRLDLAYVPTPYRQETARFNVSIGGQ